jgi:hypothetical protein
VVINIILRLLKLKRLKHDKGIQSNSGIVDEQSKVFLFIYFTFLCGTRVLTKGFALVRQVLYHLSHTSSPFFSGYFGDGGSHELFAWAGLKLQSSQSQLPD